MARPKTIHTCQNCSYTTHKWMGRCPECKEWNTFVEESATKRKSGTSSAVTPTPLLEVRTDRGGEIRMRTGLSELDNPLGGGLVAGSLVLIGGDPGVGKSTLLLMAADRFARRGLPILYVTGEESLAQIKLRANRLGVAGESVLLLASTEWDQIEAAIRQVKPTAVILDSVQTVAVPELDGIPGSVAQVREVAHRAMKLAKSGTTAVILVGHITKSGSLAGPKVLEHFVDTVLYFEGDGRTQLRILRSVKNRFGAAGELGLFEMADDGLREVPDASARLLEERQADAPGTAVIATLEGNRPLLIEVQALVGRPSPAIPARTCVGIDRNRVLMLAAVLEKAGMSLHDRDLFVNAAGGVRLTEPAADLGAVAAIHSSFAERPIAADTMLFGEVGLVGEVRAVSHPVPRLKEAARHGFRRVFAPRSCVADAPPGLEVIGIRSVRELLQRL